MSAAARTIRVRGERYRSPGEARAAARELRAAQEQAPEYGPARRQLRAHADELEQAAAAGERGRTAEQLHGPLVSQEQKRKRQADQVDELAARRAARARGQQLERPVRQAVGRVVDEATGPAAGGTELAFEAAGLTLATIAFYLLLRNPGIVTTSSRGLLGSLGRAVDLVDPLTGKRLQAAPPRTTTAQGAA